MKKSKDVESMIYKKLLNKNTKLSVIGLGYVGLPIAVAFAQKVEVVGFDVSMAKINLYKKGIDPTKEVGDLAIVNSRIDFTNNPEKLLDAKFHVVAVPTPVNANKTPDLFFIKSASSILGKYLTKGSIVVYESTVYPGVTEDICIPILEKESGLKCGLDFSVGYSPERINPGDKVHRLNNIVKIVSGYDTDTLEMIAKVYELVVDVGIYRASSIKVAEAAKVIENSQRDINIAFMNELSIIFNKMGVDTKEVLEAARTKWNFLNFVPGLVGGHCIGVDPYYLTYKAQQLGYHSQVILAGRKLNDDMGKYVAENIVKYLIKADVHIKGARVAILGFTFKENCPDVRNTRIIDIVNELREYAVEVVVADPIGDAAEAMQEYGIKFVEMTEINSVDAVVLAVAHDVFKNIMQRDLARLYRKHGQKVLVDVKGILNKNSYADNDYFYWRL